MSDFDPERYLREQCPNLLRQIEETGKQGAAPCAPAGSTPVACMVCGIVADCPPAVLGRVCGTCRGQVGEEIFRALSYGFVAGHIRGQAETAEAMAFAQTWKDRAGRAELRLKNLCRATAWVVAGLSAACAGLLTILFSR